MEQHATAAPRVDPRSREEWEALLLRLRIRPSRAMGQNFLVEPEVVELIAEHAEVEPGTRVIEIGPGLGILTRELLRRGCRVTGVELDDELASYLERALAKDPNFDLVRRDARYVDIDPIAGEAPYILVANLPYSVATVIIRHFVESPTPPTRLTVMVQREVAERMTAENGEMSLLGLATRIYTEPEVQFIVAPDAFRPPPKVESAVINLDVRPKIGVPADTLDRLFTLATMAFQRKRKTVANGLAQGLGSDKARIESTLSAIGIDPMRRPQALSLKEWIRIAEALPA